MGLRCIFCKEFKSFESGIELHKHLKKVHKIPKQEYKRKVHYFKDKNTERLAPSVTAEEFASGKFELVERNA